MNTLPPELRNGSPTMSEGWRLHKVACGRSRQTICEVWTHEHGWELRLTVDGELQRSEVMESQGQVAEVLENWKAVMVGKGWR